MMKKIISLTLVMACASSFVFAMPEQDNSIIIIDNNGSSLINNVEAANELREIRLNDEAVLNFYAKHKVAILCTVGGTLVVAGGVVGAFLIKDSVKIKAFFAKLIKKEEAKEESKVEEEAKEEAKEESKVEEEDKK